MKRLLWVVAPLLIVLSAGVAAAQDHLVCYKVKDPLRLRSTAPTWLDLTGPQYGSEQCKIVGALRLFCVNVDKTVTAPLERKIAPGSYEPFTPTNLAGLGEQDRVCYRIKCAGTAAPPTQIVTDQFATRTVIAPKPFLVCGPAQKLLTSTTSSTAITAPTTSVTSTSSTTSTTQPACCVAGGFLSLTTTQTNMGADAGDVTRVDGTPFAPIPNLGLGALYEGGGGSSAPGPHTLPDGSQLVAQITSLGAGCAATLGPVSSVATGSNRNCTAAGCLVGAPVPITNTTATAISFCAVSRLTGAGATGTSNCCMGTIDLSLPLVTDLFLSGDPDPAPGLQPCPRCAAGVCVGGTNNGMACVPATTALSNSYPTSQDCPPDPMDLAGTIALDPMFTTGTVSWTGTVATNDTGSTVPAQTRVFCGYCRDLNTGQFQNPAQQCWQNGMAVGPACAGGFPDCEQRVNGAFGPTGGSVKTITAIGTTAPGICSPADARLATLFCVPPVFSPTIDAGYDLPATAASVVEATTQFCPVANPCP
jgi:hypothetical protein